MEDPGARFPGEELAGVFTPPHGLEVKIDLTPWLGFQPPMSVAIGEPIPIRVLVSNLVVGGILFQDDSIGGFAVFCLPRAKQVRGLEPLRDGQANSARVGWIRYANGLQPVMRRGTIARWRLARKIESGPVPQKMPWLPNGLELSRPTALGSPTPLYGNINAHSSRHFRARSGSLEPALSGARRA